MKAATFTVDQFRYTSRKGLWSFLKIFFSHPGFRFVFLLRVCSQTSKYSFTGLSSRIWFKRMQRKYGLQIPHHTKIGGGLFLGHYGNIVINADVSIGENCNIAQGVTIGQVNRGAKQGCPTIGSRVWIGANSVIVGKIVIGDDVLIAPLSYVNFDVPDKAVVSGNPAQIVSFNGSGGYINNVSEIE